MCANVVIEPSPLISVQVEEVAGAMGDSHVMSKQSRTPGPLEGRCQSFQDPCAANANNTCPCES